MKQKRFWITLFMGFSAGMPLLMTGSTLQAWMSDQKVDLAVIGIFSLVGLPYALKFLWAPFLDRFALKFLGRRRGWLFVTQVFLILSVAAFSFVNPRDTPFLVALLAFFTAFFSATQDILIDAFRRESLQDQELGMGSTLYIYGYRIGMLVAGAFALLLADQIPWHQVYLILSGILCVSLLTTLWSDEPQVEALPPRTLREAVIEPFLEYFQRKNAWFILAFILLYKLGDNMAMAMNTPFFLSLGFTKTDIGVVAKTFGMGATFLGGFLGGTILYQIGIHRSLWAFGFLQAFSILVFSGLALVGQSYPALILAIGFENLAAGMGTSAYTAFMASQTNKKFTATQYALLSSLMGIPRVVAAAPTGYLAKNLGWFWFYVACAIVAIPGMLLLFRVKHTEQESNSDSH